MSTVCGCEPIMFSEFCPSVFSNNLTVPVLAPVNKISTPDDAGDIKLGDPTTIAFLVAYNLNPNDSFQDSASSIFSDKKNFSFVPFFSNTYTAPAKPS